MEERSVLAQIQRDKEKFEQMLFFRRHELKSHDYDYDDGCAIPYLGSFLFRAGNVQFYLDRSEMAMKTAEHHMMYFSSTSNETFFFIFKYRKGAANNSNNKRQ